MEYKDKQKAVLAYNNLVDLNDVIDYMKTYSNEPSAFKWELILKDEYVETKEEKQEEETFGEPRFGGRSFGS